eukprot:7378079-Prymnesium_polylepis.2
MEEPFFSAYACKFSSCDNTAELDGIWATDSSAPRCARTVPVASADLRAIAIATIPARTAEGGCGRHRSNVRAGVNSELQEQPADRHFHCVIGNDGPSET